MLACGVRKLSLVTTSVGLYTGIVWAAYMLCVCVCEAFHVSTSVSCARHNAINVTYMYSTCIFME